MHRAREGGKVDDDNRTHLRVCEDVIKEDESARCLNTKGFGDVIDL